jgi:hypothetical protein
MSVYFEFHPENFFVLPLLAIAEGECDNPGCEAQHFMVAIGWFAWTLQLHFEF